MIAPRELLDSMLKDRSQNRHSVAHAARRSWQVHDQRLSRDTGEPSTENSSRDAVSCRRPDVSVHGWSSVIA